MRLRDARYLFGLAVPGALLVCAALFAVGTGLAFAVDSGWFLVPAGLFASAYAASWGQVQNKQLRALHARYERHLRRKNGQE